LSGLIQTPDGKPAWKNLINYPSTGWFA
jgi:hypothetical protein